MDSVHVPERKRSLSEQKFAFEPGLAEPSPKHARLEQQCKPGVYNRVQLTNLRHAESDREGKAAAKKRLFLFLVGET